MHSIVFFLSEIYLLNWTEKIKFATTCDFSKWLKKIKLSISLYTWASSIIWYHCHAFPSLFLSFSLSVFLSLSLSSLFWLSLSLLLFLVKIPLITPIPLFLPLTFLWKLDIWSMQAPIKSVFFLLSWWFYLAKLRNRDQRYNCLYCTNISLDTI